MNDSQITVLIADDEEDMRVLVRVTLRRAGLRVVDEVDDGLAAVAAVERLDPPPVPTVLVLDHRMPGLSGLEVAERVLAEFPEQHIVLFSAFLTDEAERRARELGVSACVHKDDLARLPEVIAGLAVG